MSQPPPPPRQPIDRQPAPPPKATIAIRTPLHDRFTLDEDITSNAVHVVRTEHELEQNPNLESIQRNVQLRTLLNRIDRTNQHVYQVREASPDSPNPDNWLPLVKIATKLDLRDRLRAEEDSSKAQKRQLASNKEIAVSWNIDEGDLARYCDRLTNFLLEGRKVQVTLATKVGTKGAVPEEKRRAVLMAMRETATSARGTKEYRPPETGQPRGGNPTILMYFQGATPTRSGSNTPSAEVEAETSSSTSAAAASKKPGREGMTPEVLEKIRKAEEKHRMKAARRQEREQEALMKQKQQQQQGYANRRRNGQTRSDAMSSWVRSLPRSNDRSDAPPPPPYISGGLPDRWV